ncbi:MAG: hypothetical protein KAX05_05900 [Bacteroidales bacterium]|nr:hypothetical protein [Bacteroidales bacterium]
MKSATNTPGIKTFIKENTSLFWYVEDSEKQNITIEFLVETILNFGDEKSVKKLFDLVGINKVAEIFCKQTSRKRVNYQKRTVHFFNLYFKRHAQRDFIKTAT